MDWVQPLLLLLAVPAVLLLWYWQRNSTHPMSPARGRALLAVRAALVVLILLALASPAWFTTTSEQAVIFVLDHSQSQGDEGIQRSYAQAAEVIDSLPAGTQIGFVSAGRQPLVLRIPSTLRSLPEAEREWLKSSDEQTDLGQALSLARGLFPAGTSRRMVVISDGLETRGDAHAAALDAALSGIVIDALPVAGKARPDVQVVRLASSRSRLHEGASLELRAELESSLAGKGRIRLFENGIEVESRELELEVGKSHVESFRRTPDQRNLYTYRVRVEGFEEDALVENDEAMTLVDVLGRPLLLYVEGEPDEAHYLAEAMSKEGIRLQTRPAEAFPETLQELAGYDGVILSDVPAHRLSDESMSLVRDYVEQLGGGFLMIGGKQSFGVGGYYRTPIEDVLPVKMKAPDKEERYATALALVIDRSGSMRGQKIEICKSAAVATVDLLSPKDYIGVVAFDSAATWVVPITRATDKGTITTQVSGLNSGGGTNIMPGMTAAREALGKVKTKVKHMIVLTDGQTSGGNYQALAAQLKAEGVTVSTVAVGSGAASGLLQQIAVAGGGKFYETLDPANIPRIFTQDAMVHMGRLIREEAFTPKSVERHPMLKGWASDGAPQLLGYVKTNRKATSQVPLVTDLGDPLLAHWRFGLGKVTAFTSDCKSRWSALWITGWPGYSQFWAQVLRETAREPQGQNMDIRLTEQSGTARIKVDVMEDAAHFKNNQTVEADVYFLAAGSLGSTMQHLKQVQLEQTGPGRYESGFTPDEPGVYLVRARSGADLVSAGLVHQVSGESATGRIDQALLGKITSASGGQVLDSPAVGLSEAPRGQAQLVELMPLILGFALLLFLADVLIRRWENVLGMWTMVRGGD